MVLFDAEALRTPLHLSVFDTVNELLTPCVQVEELPPLSMYLTLTEPLLVTVPPLLLYLIFALVAVIVPVLPMVIVEFDWLNSIKVFEVVLVMAPFTVSDPVLSGPISIAAPPIKLIAAPDESTTPVALMRTSVLSKTPFPDRVAPAPVMLSLPPFVPKIPLLTMLPVTVSVWLSSSSVAPELIVMTAIARLLPLRLTV